MGNFLIELQNFKTSKRSTYILENFPEKPIQQKRYFHALNRLTEQ